MKVELNVLKTGFLVTFYRKKELTGSIGTVEKTVEKIINAISRNPKITISQLREITGLSRRGVEWNISKLNEIGRLRRVGSTKGGYWEVVKRPVTELGVESGDSGGTNQKIHQEIHQEILDLIRKNPKITRRELSNYLGNIPDHVVRYQLDKLKKQGKIKRIGPDKGGHWQVL